MTSPQQLAEHALAHTTSTSCLVLVSTTHSANLRWANNTLTTNGVMESATMSVIAINGAQVASVSGAAHTTEQVEQLVAQADAQARVAAPSEDCQPLVVPPAGMDLDTWDLTPGQTSIDVYASFAHSLGEAFSTARAAGRILYGFVNHEITTTYLASSTGLRLRHEQPTGHYGCTGKTADLTGSAWVGGATRDFHGVDARLLDATLGARLAWGLRRVELPAGRYDTVLPPSAVADLMIGAYFSAGARVAHEGQSVYALPGGGTKVGKQITGPGVTLVSDPAYPGLECAPFVMTSSSGNDSSVFDNGLPLARTEWIRDGRLTALIQTRHSSTLTDLPTTAAIDNLVLSVEGASGDEMDLVRCVDRGLLLTCLWYIREVDPQSLLLTGLTRDGVYLIEGGEIVGAVNNFRFNESPIDLLNRIHAASATQPSFSREWGEDYFSRTATPALRISDFNMSSVSQAL